MKVFFTKKTSIVLIFVLGLLGSSWGQVTIASQDFETTPATPTLTFTNTNGANSTGTNGAGRPANSSLFVSGSRGWQVLNATSTLTFANQSLAGYTNCFVDFRLAGMNANTTVNGIDGADLITVFISVDGGTTYSSELTIGGSAANQFWDFTSTGSTSITYDGNNTPTAVTVTTGATAITTATINIPNVNSQVRVRISMLNNSADERWVIDDVRIRGTVANAAPTASAVAITGTTVVGQTLTGSYTYADAEGNTEGTSTFKWYRANDVAGTGEVAIAGATATTYTLTGADLNKFIRFSVVPVATTGTLTGVETFSGRVGPVTSNNNSTATITVASGFTATPNVPYINFVGTNVLPTSHELARFSLNDVAGATDDGLTTTLTALTLSLSNSAQIERVALYDDANTEIQEIAAAATLNFTGLNIVAPSGSNINFSVRVTYKAAVTDNVQNQVVITSATANTAGTVFAAADAGGAASSIAVDDNRIEVLATQLSFVTNTSNVNVNVAMAPSPSIRAIDAQSNIDLDFVNAISVTQSGSSFAAGATTSVNAVSGVATFSNLIFNIPATGVIINGTAIGLTTTPNSNPFNVSLVTLATDFFRSNSNNTGNGGAWSTASNWQSSSDNVTWITATATPTSTANSITIRSGHNIDITATVNADQLIIESGASLRFSGGNFTLADGTGTDMVVNGTFNRTTANTFIVSGTITVNSGATYIHATNGSSIPTATWDVGSNLNITGMTTTAPTGFGQVFGNVNWNCSGQTNFAIIGNNGAFNPKGLMTVSNTGTRVIELESDGLGSTYNFDGGLTINGGTFVVSYGSSGFAVQEALLNINGNLIVSGTGKFDIAQGPGNIATFGYGASVKITGDITITSSATEAITATATNNYGYIYFDGGTFNHNYVRTSTVASSYVDYEVSTGNTLVLQNNMQLFSASTTLYDNLFVYGTLNTLTNAVVQSSGTASRFAVFSGGTIITANTGGLVGAVAVGGAKTYTAGANYVFNGNTTTPFPPTASAFGSPASLVFNALVTSNRATSITVSGNIDISTNASFTLSPTSNNISLGGIMTIASGGTFDNNGENQITNGGGSIIVNGRFITRDVQGFTGTNTAVPTVPVTLNVGSTVEYAFNGNQAVTTRSDYQNIDITNGGSKTTNNAITPIAGTVKVNAGATLDVGTNTFGGGSTNLTLVTTGKFINGGSGVKPDIGGNYNLGIGSTVEFMGTSATQVRVAPSYYNMIVSGSNVSTSTATATLMFQSGGSFTVTNTGNFKVRNTDGFSGSTNTAVNSNNSPSIVLATGSTIEYVENSNQAITNALPYQNIILSGAGTKTAPAGTLTVLGNFTKNNAASVFNANGGTVAFNGTGAQVFASTNTPSTIKTATTFYDVNIGNTVGGLRIDADSMNIENSLTLGAAAKLDLGTGYVILKSTAAKTAFVAPVLGGATISYSGVGRFEIERYLFAKKSWRSLATPIDPTDPTTVTQAWRENASALTSTGYGTQISGPATYVGTDQTTVRGSLKSFDMNLGDFVEVTNMDATPIYNRSGYFVFVRGDRAVSTTGTTGATTLRMKGKLLVGTQTYTVAGDKFLSVGNPFAARIDMKQAIANTRTGGMVEAFTVWNPNSPGSYNVGAYQTYIKDLSTGDYKLNGIGAVNNFVESGQAVFIQAIGATGSFAIGEGDKVSGSSLVSRGEVASRTGVTVPTLDIALNTNDVNGSSFTADATLVNFGNFNDGIDVMDVKKTFNTADNIAIKANNQYLVAERKTMPQANDTIFLHIASLRTTNYSFEINPSLLGGLGLEALLIDRFLGTSTPVSLTDVSTINFTTTADAASKANNRFAIVFKPAAVLPVTFTTITAERDGGSKQIAVKWHVSTELNINRYEVERSATGTNFITLGNTNPTNNTGSAATYVYHDAAPLAATNYYRVKAISNNGAVQYSAVVKVAALPIANGFVVYPNPVVGNTINLQANQVTKGAYSVQLVNATGQIVYKGAININSDQQSTSIALDAATAPGKYTLVLVGADGKVSVGVVVR
ncbi:T9SS type A sorting domain-containing protein [Ferruginibacter yonginensis]|uniref:T9SS type A sorting domain-containing protein n=1 Tax=Ferruginibacter yonginensis TaxID=1310416 RepID=A0ABV8QLQ4_9BACT